MDGEEITALAREYAEESANEVGLPNCLQNETFGLVVTETECVIKWLLRRFCLVEKEAVRKQFYSAKRLIEVRNYNKQCIGVGSRGVLERLFPEIAKEMEQ